MKNVQPETYLDLMAGKLRGAKWILEKTSADLAQLAEDISELLENYDDWKRDTEDD